MAKSGGGRSLAERLKTAAASPVTKIIIKATDSDALAPKKKHMESLLLYTHRQDLDMAEIVEGLFNRLEGASWVVTLKTLIVIHRCLRDGHERFLQYLCSRSHLLELHDYMDRKLADGLVMSGLIHDYSAYINRKIVCDRKLGFDVTHVKGGLKAKITATQNPPQLFDTIKNIQSQLDSLLLAVSGSGNCVDKQNQGHGTFEVQVQTPGNTAQRIFSNPVTHAAAVFLRRDCLKYFIAINDGIVNILERYFQLPKREALIAFEIYEKFITECQQIDAFMQQCRTAGVVDGRGIPNLTQAPTVLLVKMKEYLDTYGQGTFTLTENQATARSSHTSHEFANNEDVEREQEQYQQQAAAAEQQALWEQQQQQQEQQQPKKMSLQFDNDNFGESNTDDYDDGSPYNPFA